MNSKMFLPSAGVVLLVVGALAGYLYGVDSTPTKTMTVTTVSTTSDAYDQVDSTYANRLVLLGSRNISALVSGYESNATVSGKEMRMDWQAITMGHSIS